MSYFTNPKRKSSLISLTALLVLSFFTLVLTANRAYADPEKKVDDTTEMVDENPEQVEDVAKDKMPAPADSMKLSQPEEPKTGSTEETPIETAPEKAIKEPAVKQPADFSTPVPGVTMPTLDKTQSCYKQEGGTYECICEGDKDCTELTNSGICEPNTVWHNENGFGGCTKKAE